VAKGARFVFNFYADERRRNIMADSVYKIIEVVGTSDLSWEDAARNAVETAGSSIHDLRVAEITRLDMTIEDGKIKSYRARVNISFRFED
jgi:flavin-binding protein dodecin